MRKTLLVLGMVVALVGFMTMWAQADEITGGITITGAANFNNSDLTQADSVSFPSPSVSLTSSDYSSIPAGTAASLQSFTWTANDVGGSITLANSSEPMWSVTYGGNEYTFTLSSSDITSIGSGSIDISGTGTLSATGYSDTQGTFTFDLTSQGGTFGFTDSNGAVPEPATLLLLGVGLLGLGLIGLKWKNKA